MTERLNLFSVMTLSPQLDFGDDAFVPVRFRLCRFLFNWISAMSWIRGALVFLGPKEVDLSFSLRHDQGNIVFPTDAANANPDGGVAAPNANVRSCQETETDPDNGGSRLERPTTRGDHDQESGLGLACVQSVVRLRRFRLGPSIASLSIQALGCRWPLR